MTRIGWRRRDGRKMENRKEVPSCSGNRMRGKNFIEERELEGRGMKRKTCTSNFAQVAVQQGGG